MPSSWIWKSSLVAWAMLAGCTPTQYAKQADKSAYSALASGQKAVLGKSLPFEVAYGPFDNKASQPGQAVQINGKVIALGDDKATVLTLEDCLGIAFRNSRDYQARKEDMYTLALGLANARRGWDFPLLGGSLDAGAAITRVAEAGDTKSASAELGPTLTQKLISGGALTLAATLDWVTDFVPGSDGQNVATSLLEANFKQPLLRGAWRGLAYEPQHRLERDFLFSVFEYERFRQEFAASILTSYYSVLRGRDELENERTNIQRLAGALAVEKVLVEGGQKSRLDQDEAEQDLLDAQVRFEQNQQSYRNALDGLKITLGLPIQAAIELDYPNALKELTSAGLEPIPFQEAQAIDIALLTRPDVLTQRANVRDADRDVQIAADQFYPQLDVEVGISAPGTEPRKFQRVQFHRNTRFAAADFHYELDQTDHRDGYRLAMLAYDRARRELDGFLDGVQLEVRESYRELVQSKQTYELRVRNVRIAERRQKLASLKQKEGEVSARDVLTAEDALRRAQNGMTSALVSYTTTRAKFLVMLGMITVDEKGMLHERKEPFEFDRLRQRYPYVGSR